jgi:hypothetical protein
MLLKRRLFAALGVEFPMDYNLGVSEFSKVFSDKKGGVYAKFQMLQTGPNRRRLHLWTAK